MNYFPRGTFASGFLSKFRGIPIFLFVLAVVFCPQAGAQNLSYKYKAGDKYRILSTVNQDIYVNRKLGYRAEIVNRISMEVKETAGTGARLTATFQSAEKTVAAGAASDRSTPDLFQWAKDYNSEFYQDRLGYITIDDQYYMPMVRNVPVFPERDLRPGDIWSADGVEVHDFRDSYGIEKPYQIPFRANYTFLGNRTWKGKNYPAFSVSYRIFYEPPAVPGKIFPRRILGASDQIVYWDMDHGQAAAYEEDFRMVIDLSDGQTWDYQGKASAEVVEAPPMDKEQIAREIAEEIKNVEDTSVRISDEGIVISLENIQFEPDSSVMLPGEFSKLDKIAEILMRYPERDILVGGHTALARTAEGRMQLSLERAGVVADYLIAKKVRTPERVVIRGYGAEQPIADNNTPQGMQRNRRVEIIILEN